MDIVFAHFYKKLPDYLVLNLKRTVHLFPSHRVILVTDQDLNRIKIEGLHIVKYRPSSDWRELESILTHPAYFRNNFWFISLARFIALGETRRDNAAPFLHVESDVLLAPDFPFKLFGDLESDFSFPIINRELAIASTLFIKNGEAASHLARFTMECARSNNRTTDMHVLSDLLTKSQEKVFPLSSGSIEGRFNDSGESPILDKMRLSLLYFEGIFDGYDIGRYLFGDDPRNNRGFSVLRRPDQKSYLNPRNMDFVLDRNRGFLSIRVPSSPRLQPIYSLHIHCKNLHLFKQSGSNKQITKAAKDSKLESRRVFSGKVFMQSLFQAILRRINLLK